MQIERALARLGREDLVLDKREHAEHRPLYLFDEELFSSREVVPYCDRSSYFTNYFTIEECVEIEAFCDSTAAVDGLPRAPLRSLTDL